MKLQNIMDMWEQDCKISDFKLDETSRLTPTLHAKYLSILSKAKLQLRSAELAQKRLLKNKWEWYNGKMDQETMERLGWEPDPFHGLKVLKGEMDYYYDSDPEIQESEEKIAYYKACIDTLKEIVDALKWRHQTIGNIIKWKQFEAGG